MSDLLSNKNRIDAFLKDIYNKKEGNELKKLLSTLNKEETVIHKWEKGSHGNKTLFKYHVQSMKYYFKKWGVKII